MFSQSSSVIREGAWKLIRYHADSREVLYDLEKDLGEATDMLDEHPQIAERLSNRLLYALSEMGAKFPKKDPQYDPEKRHSTLKILRRIYYPGLKSKGWNICQKILIPRITGGEVRQKINYIL